MVSAGYDPYFLELAREEREHRWEQTRPICECCGDRIFGDIFEIDDARYCEGCVGSAWDTVQAHTLDAVKKMLESHVDFPIIEDIVNRMIETFDFSDYESDIRKVE